MRRLQQRISDLRHFLIVNVPLFAFLGTQASNRHRKKTNSMYSILKSQLVQRNEGIEAQFNSKNG